VDGSMRERLEKALDAVADLDPDELRTLPGEDLKWLAQDRAVEIRHRAELLLAILNHRIGPGC
jgi:adenylylsulfate kinase-like enzyme